MISFLRGGIKLLGAKPQGILAKFFDLRRP